MAQYLKKGRPVFVEGRMQTRSWDDKETGKKNYRTEVIVENFQFGAQAGQGASGQGMASREEEPASGGSTGGDIQYPEEEINPEDIPF